MKAWYNSRLVRQLLLIVGASAVVYLRRYLPAEIAGLLVDEVLATVGVAAGLGALRLRAQDRKNAAAIEKVTVGALLDRKAAKAAAKVGLLFLTGCGPHWQVCEVDLSNHPVKPAPAASARVRCTRTVLCDVAEGATCDGETLAKGAK